MFTKITSFYKFTSRPPWKRCTTFSRNTLPSSSVKTADPTSSSVLSSCNCRIVAERLDVGGVRARACVEFDKREEVEAVEFVVDPPLLVPVVLSMQYNRGARAGEGPLPIQLPLLLLSHRILRRHVLVPLLHPIALPLYGNYKTTTQMTTWDLLSSLMKKAVLVRIFIRPMLLLWTSS